MKQTSTGLYKKHWPLVDLHRQSLSVTVHIAWPPCDLEDGTSLVTPMFVVSVSFKLFFFFHLPVPHHHARRYYKHNKGKCVMATGSRPACCSAKMRASRLRATPVAQASPPQWYRVLTGWQLSRNQLCPQSNYSEVGGKLVGGGRDTWAAVTRGRQPSPTPLTHTHTPPTPPPQRRQTLSVNHYAAYTRRWRQPRLAEHTLGKIQRRQLLPLFSFMCFRDRSGRQR